MTARERLRLAVRGIVQGVGFRPFVYTLAQRGGLSGHVGNDADGVFIEIEGAPDALAAFQHALRTEAPPLALIESVQVERIAASGEAGFRIVESAERAHIRALIPPDLAICADCLRELFDPTDRRYRYPFINCTHCGPRFTIIRALPYDRSATTMAGFGMCADCAREYHDPTDRRFHAQPNACPVCGPRVRFQRGDRPLGEGEDALRAALAALAAGEIVAIKGLGGFHLACDAVHDDALRRLRERKGRVDKPFAVMVRDLDAARALAHIDEAEAERLTSRQRPIVLLRARGDSPLSALVAPGNRSVGLMLPYTPLHYLLVGETPLVMTSGNLSGEPIASDDADALARLAPLVDAFLLHNRPIHTPCDDSVVRLVQGVELPVRRSRGYTPFPVRLPTETRSVLAVGGELKNTFCLTHDGWAFMSQHIGDMENLETLTAFERAVDHLCGLYRAQPTALVCDLHPHYLTTAWAEREAQARGLPLLRAQHHHAHIASVMAEHGLDGSQRVIGVCFDGTGYGTDGAIWGGEWLIADYAGFERAAHLRYVPLPGGDAAVKRPYRLALAHLWAAGIDWEPTIPAAAACPAGEMRILRRQFETGFQTVRTSSMGRLFDAVAALIGLRQQINYEAQAAIELENAVDAAHADAYTFALGSADDGSIAVEAAPVIRAVVEDVRAGLAAGMIAARFHHAVADVAAQVCDRLRMKTGIETVALSGGVFQNVTLAEAVSARLAALGLRVLMHHVVPTNDGGLALGQAMVGQWGVGERSHVLGDSRTNRADLRG